MIAGFMLFALTVIPVNDPLAPLQLLHAEVTPQGDTLHICANVRNESPYTVNNVHIDGSIHDASQSVTVFLSTAAATSGKEGIPPGGEFSSCTSIPGVHLHGNAVIQIAVK